jgi:SAM-dependent methyltransferase
LVGSGVNTLKAMDKVYTMTPEGIPLLLANGEWTQVEVKTVTDKLVTRKGTKPPYFKRLAKKLTRNHWNKKAVSAKKALFSDTSLAMINIGGGPGCVGHCLNLNISPFFGVDIVADAHQLPFANNSIDRINCEAVLEHLYDPALAIKEMFRVLKPGGKVFCATPFLQHYHGYPHHYQNLTKTGQEHLFKKNGFQITESGVAVGPTDTLITLTSIFLLDIFPKSKLVWIAYLLISAPFRWLDHLLFDLKNAHLLASVTYTNSKK